MLKDAPGKVAGHTDVDGSASAGDDVCVVELVTHGGRVRPGAREVE